VLKLSAHRYLILDKILAIQLMQVVNFGSDQDACVKHGLSVIVQVALLQKEKIVVVHCCSLQRNAHHVFIQHLLVLQTRSSFDLGTQHFLVRHLNIKP